MEWAALVTAVVKFLSTVGPAIALWLAFRSGKTAGGTEQVHKQTEANAKARQEYERIEVEGVSDADTDRILKDHSL